MDLSVANREKNGHERLKSGGLDGAREQEAIIHHTTGIVVLGPGSGR